MVLKYMFCENWHITLLLYDLIINVSNCNSCKEAGINGRKKMTEEKMQTTFTSFWICVIVNS